MGWRQFVMDLESLEIERVEEVLNRHGALAVTLTDGGDDPVLEPARGETPLWHSTRVTGLFDEDKDLVAMRSDLQASLNLSRLPRWQVDELTDRCWEREWLKDFGPMQFGTRLWVVPHGATAPEDATVVRLDPGLAFGTGTHPTTALCLEWLDEHVTDAWRVLDFGCGSGILAVAALQLGAAFATGIDNDPQAIQASAQNAADNAVAERLTLTETADHLGDDFTAIVANVLADPLIELAAEISDRLAVGGYLALSGILRSQADRVMRAYADTIDFSAPRYREDWALLHGRRR